MRGRPELPAIGGVLDPILDAEVRMTHERNDESDDDDRIAGCGSTTAHLPNVAPTEFGGYPSPRRIDPSRSRTRWVPQCLQYGALGELKPSQDGQTAGLTVPARALRATDTARAPNAAIKANKMSAVASTPKAAPSAIDKARPKMTIAATARVIEASSPATRASPPRRGHGDATDGGRPRGSITQRSSPCPRSGARDRPAPRRPRFRASPARGS